MSQTLLRRTLPAVVVFVLGVTLSAVYFTPAPEAQSLGQALSGAGSVVTGFASAVGFITLIRRDIMDARKRAKGTWQLAGMRVVLALGVLAIGVVLGTNSYVFTWLVNTLVFSGNYAMSALFLFSIIVVLFRGSIIKRVEGAIFIAAMVVMLLYNAPLTAYLWPGIIPLGTWVIGIGTGTGMTAILLGLGVALTIMGIRIIIGRERAVQ
jgi:hypothetical protein